MLPNTVASHYRQQQRLKVGTIAQARGLWAQMSLDDFDASWAAIGPRLLLLLIAAQYTSAQAGAAYVPITLAELGISTAPVVAVRPRGFAGRASDGRELDGLLLGAVTTAKTAVKGQLLRGAVGRAAFALALAVGGRWLDMTIATQLADASRSAASVAITATPDIGYVRMVNLPTCGRCAILAGRVYRWNAAFLRHPGCDCTQIPTDEPTAYSVQGDPEEIFASGQVTGLSELEKQMIDNGANAGRIVNAHRNVWDGQRFTSFSAGIFTTEGTTRGAGSAIQRRLMDRQRTGVPASPTNINARAGAARDTIRPTPDAIYRYATSRTDALRLLAANGYTSGA